MSNIHEHIDTTVKPIREMRYVASELLELFSYVEEQLEAARQELREIEKRANKDFWQA